MTGNLHFPPTLTYHAAQGMVATAIAHAMKNGWVVAVAVLDPSGGVLSAGRMDGAVPTILEIATDKAFTATQGRSTDAFGKRMLEDPQMTLAASNRPRMVAWEGGLPIRADGVVVGAIGVSGASGHEDAACAQAAVERLGFTA
ncbi:heme-binding protein [uncultured Tateyamaria sp.]|uniref:GlcG/HbpS family heme-binding protein n=1 Tax=Tateyamaria sp. TaxID=1929288 RepID=UPI002605CE70|nr:heme-binding protein [uncultured Tateyamaria sp.]